MRCLFHTVLLLLACCVWSCETSVAPVDVAPLGPANTPPVVSVLPRDSALTLNDTLSLVLRVFDSTLAGGSVSFGDGDTAVFFGSAKLKTCQLF